MGYTIDYAIHQSVATMAHTDNYKLPPRPTQPSPTQNSQQQSTSVLIAQTWSWGQKSKERFCHMSPKEAIDTHFLQKIYPTSSQVNDTYLTDWTKFLNCIIGETIGKHPKNDDEFESSMRILRQVLCEEEHSNNAITSQVRHLSNYFNIHICVSICSFLQFITLNGAKAQQNWDLMH